MKKSQTQRLIDLTVHAINMLEDYIAGNKINQVSPIPILRLIKSLVKTINKPETFESLQDFFAIYNLVFNLTHRNTNVNALLSDPRIRNAIDAINDYYLDR